MNAVSNVLHYLNCFLKHTFYDGDCGNALENNSQPLVPVSNCTVPVNSGSMRCKGDPTNFCGGPSLLYLYSLSGSGLTPLIPFGSTFDGFCDDCVEFGFYI